MLGRMAALAVVVGLVASVSGCSTTGGSGASGTQEKSLYDRLGGKPAITAVVDDFVGRVAADTRINGKFANANIPRLKTMLVDQICQASGGPCTYTGRDMKSTHAGMGISASDWVRFMDHVGAMLAHFGVPDRERGEVAAFLQSLRSDVVEAP